MPGFLIGVFIVLHGLVHLFYFGQSRRLFELQPGMVWPDGSWAFSKFFGTETTRSLAGTACVIAAIGFVAGGIGLLMGQALGRPLILGAAVFSTAIFVLFWDKKLQKLADKGGVGILINIAIVIVLFILRYPAP